MRADTREAVEQAMTNATAALEQDVCASSGANRSARVRTIKAAVSTLPHANLSLISVPGEFAAIEARRALALGMNVMIFSDNVPVEQERGLKEYAREKGLLVMGPDCGTAIIAGTPLAFSNEIPHGHIGVVSAAGTGLQEFSVLIARHGHGISHGIGVGGRDLSDAVGAITTETALDALEEDPQTEQIVLISKPPGEQTVKRILRRLERCRKQVIACLLGLDNPLEAADNVTLVRTIKAAAEYAVGETIGAAFSVDQVARTAGGKRGWIRGLYSGGALCAEAQVVLRDSGLNPQSNVPTPGCSHTGRLDAGAHVLIDLGSDEYTAGRPHPMIEPAVRSTAVASALEDPQTAVILLDVVLGYGAHSDPAGAITTVLDDFDGKRPAVVASVCGTEGDIQGLHGQIRRLEGANVIVAPSNAHAAEVAARIVQSD
ncbi:MAG: acyl-CoA synthetase FdrA [Gammaproteobacteria bacterium]